MSTYFCKYSVCEFNQIQSYLKGGFQQAEWNMSVVISPVVNGMTWDQQKTHLNAKDIIFQSGTLKLIAQGIQVVDTMKNIYVTTSRDIYFITFARQSFPRKQNVHVLRPVMWSLSTVKLIFIWNDSLKKTTLRISLRGFVNSPFIKAMSVTTFKAAFKVRMCLLNILCVISWDWERRGSIKWDNII